MSVVSVKARSFILALFIRDDGERFLLGDNGYDFKDSQLHFAANTIENDEVMKQGADGVIVAGQVRRASVQSFDGFVGDATMAKETIEQMRRDFFAFFVKGHHFRVIYIDCNRNAWQRKGGYLVDAPEVKELWQIHPEYHVGLNFEDVNYYSYDEDADGEEILSNLVDVPVSTAASGGLVWDEDGAVSEDVEVDYDIETAGATGKAIAISDAAEAPLASFKLDGETSQNGTPTPSAPVAVSTTTGENVVQICGKNLFDGGNADYTAGDAWEGYGNPSYLVIDNGYKFENRYRAIAFEFDNLAVGQQYVVSFDVIGNHSFTAGVGVNVYNGQTGGSSQTYNGSTASQRISFTFTAATNNRIAFNSGTTADTVMEITSIQLELGSTATAYEPYQGQSYEVNLDIGGGKNLLKYSWPYTTGYYDGSGNWSTDARFACYDKYFEVEPNTTYSFSSSHSNTNMAILWFDENKNWISRTATTSATSASGTSPATAKYARLQVRYETGTIISYWLLGSMDLQFEQGSVSSYEPFVCYELCKIGGYQDYIYKSGDKWYVHKAVGKEVLSSSDNWGVRSDVSINDCTVFVDLSYVAGSFATNSQAYSSHFVYASSYSSGVIRTINANGYGLSPVVPNSIIGITGGDDASTKVAKFKTWIGSNTVSVYYIALAATEEEITNQALITQLNALLTTARTYAGTNNIFTITPNEQGTLEVSYYTKYQLIVTGGGYVWEAGGSGGATIVVNNSIDNVNPIWKIYGPTMNPQLENSTTGEVIEYVGLIAEGQTLTIDMGEQTASLDGLNVISNLVGDFISLAPGANRLIYSVSGDAGASEIGWSEIVG